jgi:ketosteroid isomerase-like protein
MKNLFRSSFVLLCFLLLASISIGGPVRTSNSSTEEFVGFLEDAWVNAILTKDFNVLNHVMADDFGGISPNGYPYSKGEAIADLKSGNYVVESMALDHLKVRVLGDMALVTYYQSEKSRFGNEDCSGRYAFTDVWAKRDGAWQAVASQGTPVVLP